MQGGEGVLKRGCAHSWMHEKQEVGDVCRSSLLYLCEGCEKAGLHHAARPRTQT